jgi:ribosome recycling factor
MDARRQSWTDERMDDFARHTEEFAERTEENFKEVRREIKSEVGGLRTEMNDRFALLEAKLDRRFDLLFGALATGFVAAVVQHFIG